MVFLIRGSFQLEWGLELGGWPGSVGFWGASPCPQGRLRHSSAAPPKPRSPPRPQERPAGGGGPAPAAPLPTPCPHPSVSSPARPGSGETARACLPGVGRGGAVTWPCLSRSWRAPSLSRPRPRLLGLPVILVRAPLRACARPPTAGAGPGRYAPSHRALGSRPAGTASPMQSPRSPSIHAAGCSSQATYSTWEPEEHILDPRLVMAYEEKEERDRASGYRKRGPKPKRLLLQRLYSMDLRSSHKAKGKEKLCFSLTCPLGSGSPEGVVKAGTPELVDKGPLVPTLPFPLRKPRKAHKYLRLSRKKFPPRGPNLESHSHRRELFLQEQPAPDVLQAAGEWEPAAQPPEEEDADLAEGPPPWTPALPPSEVTVTDITANSITVTFREAQAAEGFFRDRSGKF
ncbi:chromobox protein homolog 7 isoform X4 [Callithrix jacchus]